MYAPYIRLSLNVLAFIVKIWKKVHDESADVEYGDLFNEEV